MDSYTQTEYLTILTHASADVVKPFADAVIPFLGKITVLQNRTGLVMLPYTDTAGGTQFHLGEVLVAESQVQIENGTQGYAVCLGRDVVQSLAIALLDAALQADIQSEAISAFIAQQQIVQQQSDNDLLRQVEATRIEMETF